MFIAIRKLIALIVRRLIFVTHYIHVYALLMNTDYLIFKSAIPRRLRLSRYNSGKAVEATGEK